MSAKPEVNEAIKKLEIFTHEPCGGAWPDEVLQTKGFRIPMCVALTTDKKTMLLLDSCDHFLKKELNKADAISLAYEFLHLANQMKE